MLLNHQKNGETHIDGRAVIDKWLNDEDTSHKDAAHCANLVPKSAVRSLNSLIASPSCSILTAIPCALSLWPSSAYIHALHQYFQCRSICEDDRIPG